MHYIVNSGCHKIQQFNTVPQLGRKTISKSKPASPVISWILYPTEKGWKLATLPHTPCWGLNTRTVQLTRVEDKKIQHEMEPGKTARKGVYNWQINSTIQSRRGGGREDSWTRKWGRVEDKNERGIFRSPYCYSKWSKFALPSPFSLSFTPYHVPPLSLGIPFLDPPCWPKFWRSWSNSGVRLMAFSQASLQYSPILHPSPWERAGTRNYVRHRDACHYYTQESPPFGGDLMEGFDFHA